MRADNSIFIGLAMAAAMVGLVMLLAFTSQPALDTGGGGGDGGSGDSRAQDYISSRSNKESAMGDTAGDGADGDPGDKKGKGRKSGNESSAIGTLR